MTGGVGRAELREFYAMHFIPKMPPDMEMTPLSRTIGTDQLVDEMVVSPPRRRIAHIAERARHPRRMGTFFQRGNNLLFLLPRDWNVSGHFVY